VTAAAGDGVIAAAAKNQVMTGPVQWPIFNVSLPCSRQYH
jgi:hypothetical protein